MTLRQQFAARHRKAPLAVSGSCRWVLPPLGDRPGILAIGDVPYLFETMKHAGMPYGWRLTRQDARKGEELSYQLPFDLTACDCPDSVYAAHRPGGCKHQAALRVAIAALGTEAAHGELSYGPASASPPADPAPRLAPCVRCNRVGCICDPADFEDAVPAPYRSRLMTPDEI